MTYRTFTQLAFVTAVAGLITLFTGFLFLRGTVSPYAEQVVLALQTLKDVLQLGINQAYSDFSSNELPLSQSKLLKQAQELNAAYYQAAFELRVGRMSVKSIKPFVGIVERSRAELSWGVALPQRQNPAPTPEDREFFRRFKPSAILLSDAMLSGISLVQTAIVFTFEVATQNPAFSRPPNVVQIEDEKQKLQLAVKEVKKQLRIVLSELSMTHQKLLGREHDELQRQMSIACLFMISLLQVRPELLSAKCPN